jgi:hypothetical protein
LSRLPAPHSRSSLSVLVLTPFLPWRISMATR